MQRAQTNLDSAHRMVPRRFSRRPLIHGLFATALTAPHLLSRTKSAQAAGLPPRNLVLLTWPDGLEEGWHPTGDERQFKLNERLRPLEPFRKKLLIIGGLKSGISAELDAHNQGPLTLWTGSRPAAGKNLSSLASVDEIVGRAIGQQTPFRSLHFGVQTSVTSNNPGHLHYAGPNQPIPSEDHPAAVFDQVFGKLPGQDAAAIARLRRRRGSVLDFLKGQIATVRQEVGASDRPKLDQHLAGVQTLEKSLDSLAQVQCTPPMRSSLTRAAALQDANFPLVCDLQTSLLTLSLQCGVTRVATLRLSNTEGQLRLPGVNENYVLHTVMHERPVAERIRINDFFMARIAKLLQSLDAVALGDGRTLLDETLVVCSSEMAVGNHKNGPMPFFIAGGGGGHLALERWVHLANAPRHTRLLTSIVQAMGINNGASVGEFTEPDSVGALQEVRA
ncbi:MAG: DUF1552 domain-containing protein [Deltaproteobacteria bacterium]|nr:DUF1552 domain-containing protein [Deltaproteobacteria bacterium]